MHAGSAFFAWAQQAHPGLCLQLLYAEWQPLRVNAFAFLKYPLEVQCTLHKDACAVTAAASIYYLGAWS